MSQIEFPVPSDPGDVGVRGGKPGPPSLPDPGPGGLGPDVPPNPGPYMPPGTPPPPPSPPGVPAPGTNPAFDSIRDYLTRYGLGSLIDWAWEQLLSGRSADEVSLSLRDRPEFRSRFRGMFDRETAGLPPISVDEYLAYEDNAYQMIREFGFPPGFYDDPDDFADLIGRNVSINELQQRLASYADAAAVGRETYRQELGRFVNGAEELSVGDLAAVLIDADRALPVLRQQFAAAGVSTAARDAGFGPLSFGEASRLTGAGITEDQARQSFAQLAQQGDVTRALAGESEGVDRDTQLGAVAGEADALSALERARRRRQGGFEGGGGFSTSGEGVVGVGRSR